MTTRGRDGRGPAPGPLGPPKPPSSLLRSTEKNPGCGRDLPEPRRQAPLPHVVLVRTLGPGLVIINTAGGGDWPELGMELPVEALAKALERAGTELLGLTIDVSGRSCCCTCTD
jgi:hypothetical protein